jgi:hypothetical protein
VNLENKRKHQHKAHVLVEKASLQKAVSESKNAAPSCSDQLIRHICHLKQAGPGEQEPRRAWMAGRTWLNSRGDLKRRWRGPFNEESGQ